jgi:undecaprenyl-diphosphatase
MLRPSFARRGADAWALVAGTATVVVSGAFAYGGKVSRLEARVFHLINHLPAWLFVLAWPIEQAGNFAAGLVVALVAAVTRRFRLAVAALLVTLLDVEWIVKHIVKRERPAALLAGVIRRAHDVPAHGLSFPSGHAITVAGLATILSPYLSRRLTTLLWIVVVGACIARVYVGAHDPLDVIGGAGAGIALGSLVNLAVGVPERRSHAS